MNCAFFFVEKFLGETVNIYEKKFLKILIGVVIFSILSAIYLMNFYIDEDLEWEENKVGFIITGDINEKGWNESHYRGIKKACEGLNLQLLCRYNIPENSGKCPEAVENLISEGAKIIFLLSFNYPKEVLPLMEKYPNVTFVSTSSLEQAKNLTSCFARMYEGRYISGALAGMRTKTNSIGYVAAMPNSQVNRGINAFTLGVRRTNPDAKVFVMWTGAWQNEEVEEKNAAILIEKYNADVLTYHQNEDAVGKVAEKFGVDFIAYNALLENYSDHYLASVICRWDLFYDDILQKYLKGDLVSLRNYWIDTRQQAIMLSDYSDVIDTHSQVILSSIYTELTSGNNLIFCDEIYDNKGNLRCEENEVISDDELLKNIDWLVEGAEVVD